MRMGILSAFVQVAAQFLLAVLDATEGIAGRDPDDGDQVQRLVPAARRAIARLGLLHAVTLPRIAGNGQTGPHFRMGFNIKVDVDGPLKAFESLREDQIPWTIARALTMTANDARDAARAREGQVFTLRNDWTQKRTLTGIATKQSLTAQVYTDTANRSTGAPDYMPLQDDGGTKMPRGYIQWKGQSFLAVPTKYLRRIAAGVIPAKYKPLNLLQFATIGPPTKGQQRARRAQVRDGMYYFVQKAASGVLMIMGRNAFDARDTAQPFYILVTKANVRGRQVVEEVVTRVAQERFADNFSKAANETIANDLLRGSGIQVRL
jgi:hypothetical protein